VTATVRSADGTEIAFDRTGAGPGLVVVGGAMSDRRAVGAIAPLLGERTTVVAYDRRGRGDSGDTPPYAVEREIEDLAALVAAAGDTASVYGHSSGAVLALRAAAAGVPIDRLVLYEPPVVVDASRPPIPNDYVKHLDELVAAGRRGDAVEYFLVRAVGMPVGAVASMRDGPMWPGLEAVAHTISYDGRVMGELMFGRPLPAGRWSSVTAPTLVLDGGASPEWQRNGARAVADALPDARHVTLAGQDHGPAPDVLAPAILDFVAG